MKKSIIQILSVLFIFFIIYSCEDEGVNDASNARLRFSVDTVTFDTIFTTIGSTNRNFKVYNPYDESLIISHVKLKGGGASNFRINVDGEAKNELFEVEIPAKDSIFVFVEVTVDPTGENLPMIVQDSIEFVTNKNKQKVYLTAYGQDFNLIRKKTIKKSQTWTAEKPYLVYDYVHVDSAAVLTIEKGAKIYFHNKAAMYVNGTIKVEGSLKEPIFFQGDRLEQAYKNLPDQWSGIVLFSGSHNNSFNHAVIKNANIGLQVGTLEHNGFATVDLSNVRIQNMTYACLYALKSNIKAHNTLISNCGGYAVALLAGGNYAFYHTTIANFWGGIFDKSRNTPSLVVKNYQKATIKGETATYMGDLKATFANSIVYGTLQQEVYLDSKQESKFNYLFDHCILKVGKSFINSDNVKSFESVFTGDDYNPLFKDPTEEFVYELDTLSPAKDIGAFKYAEMFQLDILGNSRVGDKGPDLGAFERIENEKK